MTHLDEGTLLTLMDGELLPDDAGAAEQHLEACGACRGQLAEIRGVAGTFAGAMTRLDSPAPVASEITARALRQRAGASAPHRSAGGVGWREMRRAAVLVLGFGAAAAAAAVPGSPLNDWLRETLGPSPRPVAVQHLPEAGPEVRAAAFAAEAGVSVLPEQGTVRVVVSGATPELRLHAALTEGPRAGVYADGAAAEARFSTGPGRIEVSGAAAGELRIELPRNAIAATVEVNGRRYVAKQDDQLRLTIPAEDGAGPEVTFRVLQ